MPLKTSKTLTDETVRLIKKFKSGELKPIPTGIDHLDESLLGGLLPGTVLGIVGRSGHGKSYDSEEIQRNILKDPEIIYINCNWEMSHFKLLVRDISFRSGESVKQVLFDPLTAENTSKLKEICDAHRRENVFYQNEPVTAEVFNEDIENIVALYPNSKIVVSIDNLENILNSAGGQKQSMDLLLSKVNRLKNIHWFICFIILNQMNQNYVLRIEDIRKQRPIESDVYGSDQLLKLCDVLYVKVIPWKLGITEKFMVFGKDMYDWLEDFKIYDDTKDTANFDPFGTAFYFYLKLRQPPDEKNIQDVFAKKMFSRDETRIPIEKPKEDLSTPKFQPRPIDTTTEAKSFQLPDDMWDKHDENLNKEDDDNDSPF
jgi:hypothetical protein